MKETKRERTEKLRKGAWIKGLQDLEIRFSKINWSKF